MKLFTTNNDPLVTAVTSVLLGEGASEIIKVVNTLKVGDKTNFGVVKKKDAFSITVKAKDTPETKILFNQRKIGSRDFALDKLIKINEETELEEDVATITKLVKTLKVGDKTNFGVVKKKDHESITVKAKDTPETKILFKQRKIGSREFVLDKMIKLNEETELDEGPIPAIMRNREFTDVINKLYGLEKVLRPNGNIAKGVAKELGQGYIADFKKMSKTVDSLIDDWDQIVMDLSQQIAHFVDESASVDESISADLYKRGKEAKLSKKQMDDFYNGLKVLRWTDSDIRSIISDTLDARIKGLAKK